MQAELEKERIERERLANEKEDQIKRYKKEIEDLKTVKGFQEYETRKRKSIEQNVSILGTQNGGNRLWLGRNTSLLSNDSMNESYGAAQPRHDDTPASASRHIFDTSDEDNDGVEEVLEEIVASTQQPTFGSPIITPPSAPYDHCRAERFREQNSELPSISDLNDSLDLDDISDVDLLHHKNRNAPNQRVHHETTFNATTRSTTTDHNQTEMIPDSLPIGRLPPQHLAANPIESKPIRLDAPKKPFNLYKTQLPNTLSKSKTLIHLLDRCIGLPNFNSVFARLERQLLSKRQIRFLFDQFKTDLLITQLTLDELRNVNDYHPLIRDWMQKCVISSTSLADSNVDIEPSLFNYIITFFKELRRQDIDRADWLRFYHSLFAFLNAHFVPLQDDCAVHPSECECIEWMTNSFGDFLLNLSHRLHDGSHQQFQLVQQVHTFIIILSQIRAFKQSSVLLAKMDHFTTQVNQLWAQLCATNMLNLNPSEDKSAARPNNN